MERERDGVNLTFDITNDDVYQEKEIEKERVNLTFDLGRCRHNDSRPEFKEYFFFLKNCFFSNRVYT